jgi:hypothetical protein
VIRLSHLDEAERRAYRIADNKLTELGEWDEALLRDEIAGLLAEDFDLTLLGISDDDLDALLRDPEALGGDGPVEGEDDIPELPVMPVSVPGDLWQLGAHRLICGDSTAADVVGRLLGDVRPLLMVTDPPYGVEYDPSWRNAAGAAKTKRTGKVLNDDRADWREAWALFPGDVAYVWHRYLRQCRDAGRHAPGEPDRAAARPRRGDGRQLQPSVDEYPRGSAEQRWRGDRSHCEQGRPGKRRRLRLQDWLLGPCPDRPLGQ